jgi:N-acetylneuraminic acid mutarotase
MGNEASTPIPYNVQVEWRKLVSGSPAVPAGREGQVAASWENKLYIFGGGSSGGTQRADVWTFDLGNITTLLTCAFPH